MSTPVISATGSDSLSPQREKESKDKDQDAGYYFKNPADVEVLPGYIEDPVEFEEKKDLRRGLHQRHIQMIALAGTIGTGLFLGSGKAIAHGGPLGAFMGYTFVGMLVSCVCISIAELSALVPLSGAIIRHAEYFVDPALSFAQGWNSVYSSCVSLPAEITAAAVIVEFWITVNNAIWISVFGALLILSNLYLVRLYGELEFSFSMLKIMLIIGLKETKAPRRNIPKAAKRIFWRVLIFYVVSIFMVGMIVKSSDPDLLHSTGTAAQSPFVIAATRASIPVVPHIINAVVLTSAWSSGNSGMLGGSRVLYGLAREGHAPKIFLRCNRFGIPYVAVCTIGAFVSLGYMTLSDSASTVFSWFQDLVSAAAFVHWIIILVVYLRFYYGCKKQGIDRASLPWKGPFQPYAAWIGLVSETFVSAYFNLPLILVLYFGYKFLRKTKIVPLEDLPIKHFLNIARDNPEPPEVPKKGWERINILWS